MKSLVEANEAIKRKGERERGRVLTIRARLGMVSYRGVNSAGFRCASAIWYNMLIYSRLA